jgi:hypothetical protein
VAGQHHSKKVFVPLSHSLDPGWCRPSRMTSPDWVFHRPRVSTVFDVRCPHIGFPLRDRQGIRPRVRGKDSSRWRETTPFAPEPSVTGHGPAGGSLN